MTYLTLVLQNIPNESIRVRHVLMGYLIEHVLLSPKVSLNPVLKYHQSVDLFCHTHLKQLLYLYNLTFTKLYRTCSFVRKTRTSCFGVKYAILKKTISFTYIYYTHSLPYK